MFSELHASDDFKKLITQYPIIDNDKFSVCIDDLKSFITEYVLNHPKIFRSRIQIFNLLGEIEKYITIRDPEHKQIMQTMSSADSLRNGIVIYLSAYLPEANIETLFRFDLTVRGRDLWIAASISPELQDYISSRI